MRRCGLSGHASQAEQITPPVRSRSLLSTLQDGHASQAEQVTPPVRSRSLLSTQNSALSTLQDWITHRARIVGLAWPEGVADASGVSSFLLTSIGATGNLRRLGRGARGYIARALRVSVRELEALAEGKIDWIDDRKLVDVNRLSPGVTITAPATVIATPIPSSRGVPVLGRILPNGHVENFDNWTPEDGRRLAVRYTGVPDAFALELTCDAPPYRAGAALVFQTIAPGELRDDEFALITRGNLEGEAIFCTVIRETPMSLRLLLAADDRRERSIVATGDILRASRVIGVQE
jgi:hypothetical protein